MCSEFGDLASAAARRRRHCLHAALCDRPPAEKLQFGVTVRARPSSTSPRPRCERASTTAFRLNNAPAGRAARELLAAVGQWPRRRSLDRFQGSRARPEDDRSVHRCCGESRAHRSARPRAASQPRRREGAARCFCCGARGAGEPHASLAGKPDRASSGTFQGSYRTFSLTDHPAADDGRGLNRALRAVRLPARTCRVTVCRGPTPPPRARARGAA